VSDDKYDYNAHSAHLSDSDSSQNSAQGLSNYHLDVELQKSWPGLDPDPHKQKFDVDMMKQAADTIDRLVTTLSGPGAGTPTSIQQRGAPAFGPDSWAAASYLKTAAQEMASTVGKYTTDLIANLQAASRAIRSAAQSYDKSESANQRSGQNQQASAENTPPVTSAD
jgi:hypothetical protein